MTKYSKTKNVNFLTSLGNIDDTNPLIIKIRYILNKLEVFEDENKELYDELFQSGLLGILEAYNSYSSSNKTPFHIYLNNLIIDTMISTCRASSYFFRLTSRKSLEEFRNLISENENSKDIISFGSRLDDTYSNLSWARETEDTAFRNIKIKEFLDLIPLLPFNEQYVIIHIYGLFGEKKQSYREIGSNLNIFYTTVGSLHDRALKNLRQLYGNNNGILKR